MATSVSSKVTSPPMSPPSNTSSLIDEFNPTSPRTRQAMTTLGIKEAYLNDLENINPPHDLILRKRSELISLIMTHRAALLNNNIGQNSYDSELGMSSNERYLAELKATALESLKVEEARLEKSRKQLRRSIEDLIKDEWEKQLIERRKKAAEERHLEIVEKIKIEQEEKALVRQRNQLEKEHKREMMHDEYEAKLKEIKKALLKKIAEKTKKVEDVKIELAEERKVKSAEFIAKLEKIKEQTEVQKKLHFQESLKILEKIKIKEKLIDENRAEIARAISEKSVQFQSEYEKRLVRAIEIEKDIELAKWMRHADFIDHFQDVIARKVVKDQDIKEYFIKKNEDHDKHIMEVKSNKEIIDERRIRQIRANYAPKLAKFANAELVKERDRLKKSILARERRDAYVEIGKINRKISENIYIEKQKERVERLKKTDIKQEYIHIEKEKIKAAKIECLRKVWLEKSLFMSKIKKLQQCNSKHAFMKCLEEDLGITDLVFDMNEGQEGVNQE